MCHILLIDDYPEILSVLTGLLIQLGYTVTAAATPVEGLLAFQADPTMIDVVLLDYQLGPFNGLDVAHSLWGLRPELPIVLMSGCLPPDIRTRGLPFSSYLSKPFSLQMLQAVLHQVEVAQEQSGLLR